MYPVVTDSATEISMKLAKGPDGVIAPSIQETEQEYADAHAAEKRWSSDRLQRFAETQKNVKNELPEDPAKTLMEGARPADLANRKTRLPTPLGR